MTELTYTTIQLAELLHTDRHKIDQMRRAGIFKGVKLGKTYIYSASHVVSVITALGDIGADLSNEECIQKTAERMMKAK